MAHTDTQQSETTKDVGAHMKQAGRDIDREGGDLGATSTGAFKDVDVETAQQRVRDAQVALVAIGYALVDDRTHDPAKGIDGIWGPTTRDTILQFQGDYGLEETGRLDAETYEELLGSYEQALSVQSAGETDDDFSPMHPDSPIDVSPKELSEEEALETSPSDEDAMFLVDDSEEMSDVEGALSGDDIDLSERTSAHLID